MSTVDLLPDPVEAAAALKAPPATTTPRLGTYRVVAAAQPIAQPLSSDDLIASPSSGNTYNNRFSGESAGKEFKLPVKRALSRREQDIERRRQKAARKQASCQLATSAEAAAVGT